MSENTKVEAKRVFIGAGCNRVVNNVSWGASGLVSFGAQNAVAIFAPKVSAPFIFLRLNPFKNPKARFDFVSLFDFYVSDCPDSYHASRSQSFCELHSLVTQ